MRLLQLQAATALLLLAAIAVSRAFVVIPTRVRTSVPARVRTGSPLHNSIDLNSGQAATAPQLQWWDESTQLKELKIPCNELNGNALEPSALTQFLMEVGAVSASAVDAAKDTASETPLFHEHDGTLELDVTWGTLTSDKYKYWSNTTVTAHFPQEWDLRGTIDMIEEVFECASPLSFTVDDVVSKDWVKTVQASWQPCNIGSLRIRFPWHEPLAPEELKAAGQVELCLEGGRAFGTGEHSTTRLCCAWLEQTLKQFNSDAATAATARVLDYGSGSGLLGFAALKYGAAEAVGLEVDVDSIVSSLYNAEVNGLDMTFYHPREITNGNQRLQVELRRVTAANTELGYEASRTLAQSELQQFDITVANILAACLVRVAPVIADITKAGGLLAVSGVLSYQADSVIAGFTDDFDDVKVAETENEWVLITGIRKH